MKTIILAGLLLFSSAIIGQSAKLSTFEEMWIVGADFKNFKVEIDGLKDPSIFSTESVSLIQSYKDLNKIVADTPFLSLRLGKTSAKFEKESKEGRRPTITISEKQKASSNLVGWGSFLVLFEKDGAFYLGIPSTKPEKLMEYFKKNKLSVTDKKGTFKSMEVTEMRIENVN